LARQLKRRFATRASAAQLFALVEQPLLAPAYLNFLAAIAPLDGGEENDGWVRFEVDVTYRTVLKTRGVVTLATDPVTKTARLRHKGTLAEFEATFTIASQHVDLACLYDAKAPLVRWLIKLSLDRLLVQIAAAMDRFACETKVASATNR
jgi:hypothetical protein